MKSVLGPPVSRKNEPIDSFCYHNYHIIIIHDNGYKDCRLVHFFEIQGVPIYFSHVMNGILGPPVRRESEPIDNFCCRNREEHLQIGQ